MRDREQDLYEIVGGFMLMTAVFFYFYGWHIKLLLFLVASGILYELMFVRKKWLLYLIVSAVCMVLAYVSGEKKVEKEEETSSYIVQTSREILYKYVLISV